MSGQIDQQLCDEFLFKNKMGGGGGVSLLWPMLFKNSDSLTLKMKLFLYRKNWNQ